MRKSKQNGTDIDTPASNTEGTGAHSPKARRARTQQLAYPGAWLGLALVYLVTSPSNRFEAVDGFDYAAAIENGGLTDLISRFHLAYMPIAKAVYAPFRATGVVDSSYPVLIVLGALLAAATVMIFHRLLRVWLRAPNPHALFGAGGLAVSWGFWRYSAEVEVYSMATFAAVALLLFATTRQDQKLGSIVGVAVLAVAAVMAHALNIAVILVLPFLLRSRGWSGRQIAGAAMISGATLLGVTLGMYSLLEGEPVVIPDRAFLEFFLNDDLETAPSGRSILAAGAVLGSVVVAANSAFMYPTIRDALTSLYPDYSLAEQVFMGETASPWIRWVAPLSVVAAVGLLIYLIPRLRPSRWLTTTEGRLLLLWLAGYLLIVFRGANIAQPEVWIVGLLPLWALVVCAMGEREFKSGLLLATVLVLGLNTFISGFMPLYTSESRLETLSSWLEANAAPGDLVLTADGSVLARYIAYSTPAHAAHIGVGPQATALEVIDAIEEAIKSDLDTSAIVSMLREYAVVYGYKPNTGSGRLFITAEFFDPPSWLDSYRPSSAAALRSLGPDLRDKFSSVSGQPGLMVRVTD